MIKSTLSPRMALGGAVCGSVLGCFVGGLFGLIHGLVQGDLSIGLDGALVGGLVGANAGLAFGACLKPPDDPPAELVDHDGQREENEQIGLHVVPGPGPEWLPLGDCRHLCS